VNVDQFIDSHFSYRKKLVGGFYGYENSEEIKHLGPFCHGKTDSQGLLSCRGSALRSGLIVFEAKVSDHKGRQSFTHQDIYVHDGNQLWFDTANSDRIDILPDGKSFEAGEEASFQVRMPFREAHALITVEREGVLDAFTVELKGDHPTFKVPIKGSYAPNVFVSAFVTRGRVADPPATALVDLGRPSFKMGLQKIRVGWKEHELTIKAEADKPVYQTRAKAKIDLEVKAPGGMVLPKNAEVAVAVVDEALLDLMPNQSWKLLEAMMRERGYEVRTATAAMNVVGKRHFGKKALASGGGGGRNTTRELFDTLLFWKARVALGANGRASVEIPLNDSISKFRVAVIATAGDQLFGTSSDLTFTTTKDLQILPGLPLVLREGDGVGIHTTVRNSLKQAMNVKSNLETTGAGTTLDTKTIRVDPDSSQDLQWFVKVPVGIQSLQFKFTVSDGAHSDSVLKSIPVLPAVPVRTIQATLAQVTSENGKAQALTVPITTPKDALPGQGGVHVALEAKLGSSVEESIDYMRSYPYSCLEQRVSKAIVLDDGAAWKEIAQELPSYLDGHHLLKYWPSMEHGSEVLSAYVLSVTKTAGWKIPESSLSDIKTGLENFVAGKIPDLRPQVETRDLEIRKLAAIEALSAFEEKPELLTSLDITPQSWPTSADLDWWSILKRWSTVPNRTRYLGEVEQILRARLDYRGTRLTFSTEATDLIGWMMVSPDLNAARLLLTALDDPKWASDLGKLVNGSMNRRHLGLWYNTTATAWNVLALKKFSQSFEKEQVTGRTEITLGSQTKEAVWDQKGRGAEVDLSWPTQDATLQIKHAGSGQPWATIQGRAAIALKTPVEAGFKIHREVTAVMQKDPKRWSRGDVLRVRLSFESQADSSWVVVQDPIPAGATILGSGLGGDSQILNSGNQSSGRAWLAYSERGADSYRAYYEYIEKGSNEIEYTIRLNQSGKFQLPPTHVEAMYAPDIFADSPIASMEIRE
jgi:uncharacterized protein YfaS (alpha-2-macroglobulin family)